MSKTAEEIGLIVGGLAVLGVGALGYFGFLAFGVTGSQFAMLAGIGVSTTLSGVALALRPPLTPVGTANSIGFSGGVAYRRTIYGQYQVAGVLTYAVFPPANNVGSVQELLHLVYTISGHEIVSFDGVSINGFMYNFGTDILEDSSLIDHPWEINPGATEYPSDFYWQHMLFEFDCGKPANGAQPFPNLAFIDPSWGAPTAGSPATSSLCLQRGCAKVHVILRADLGGDGVSGWRSLYPSGQIPNIQFLVTGKKLIDPRIVTAWQEDTAYSAHSYIVDNNESIWFAETGGTSGSTRPSFESDSGTPGATLTDGGVTWENTAYSLGAVYNGNTLPPQLNGNNILVNDGWMPGEIWNSGQVDLFVMEAPLGYLQLLTAAGTAGTTYPTFATTAGSTTADGSATWTCLGRSTHAINPSNPALAVYDYLTDSDYGMGSDPNTIDVSSVIAAANLCEEPVTVIYPTS